MDAKADAHVLRLHSRTINGEISKKPKQAIKRLEDTVDGTSKPQGNPQEELHIKDVPLFAARVFDAEEQRAKDVLNGDRKNSP